MTTTAYKIWRHQHATDQCNKKRCEADNENTSERIFNKNTVIKLSMPVYIQIMLD